MVGARKISCKKLREDQYREGKRVEWDGENNVEHMWELVKQAMVESEREVCGSVRVRGGGND